MATGPFQCPIYTDDQLSKYLALLFQPAHPLYTLTALKEKLGTDPLATLTTLQKFHLGTIPWGNVALHYSKSKRISLDVDALFQKIVVRRHGGYCMELNTLYSTVLRSLGIKLYVTGGRVSKLLDEPGTKDPESFSGW
jgi:arylamine N-acetyltransferase